MAEAAVALAHTYRQEQSRRAVTLAALIAAYFRTRVVVEDPASIERWLAWAIPLLVRESDSGARRAAAYFDMARRIEVPGAPKFTAQPQLGTVDEGVRQSLLLVGPYDYTNKARKIERQDIPEAQKTAMLRREFEVASKKIAASAMRHAQAGSRQTIYDNAARDRVALGYVRLTKSDNPCYFCIALASRGLQYRPYSEDSFELSNARFSGDGEAKVHDNCSCALVPAFSEDAEILDQSKQYAELWAEYAEPGTSKEQMNSFRRNLRQAGITSH